MSGIYLLIDYSVKFISGFITIGLIANLIGPEDFSSLITITNSALWISLILSFGLDRALLTSSLEKKLVLELSVFITFLKVLTLTLIIFFFAYFSINFQISVFLAIGLSYEFFDYYFRRDERFKIGAFARITSSIVALILRLIIVFYGVDNLNWIVFTYFIEYFFSFMLMIINIEKERRILGFKLSFPSIMEIQRSFLIGTPVMIAGSTMFFINYWPSLIGAYFFNLKDLGLFLMAQKLCDVTNIVQNAYHQSVAPKVILITKNLNQGELTGIKKIIKIGFIIGLITIILLYFLSFIYVDYILGEDYSEILNILPILLLGQFISIWSGSRSTILLGLNKTSLDLYIIVMSSFVTAVFLYFMSYFFYEFFSPLLLMAYTVLFGKFCVAFISPLFFSKGRLVIKSQLMFFTR